MTIGGVPVRPGCIEPASGSGTSTMGMQLTVTFEGEAPAWSNVCDQLREVGQGVPGMRMIDGEIALPDESPADGWRELRVATPDGSGMITLQRPSPSRVECVVWGNASEPLQQAWRLVAWAFARAGDGQIEADGKRYSPAVFAEAMALGA